MADLKISQLTSATLPLAGTEVLPIVQSSSTKKVATDDLTVKNVRSNATTGILQIAGPGAGTTRTMTTPDANFTAARTDAAQSFTGDQTLGTGNLIQGTAAKGVNFTANTPAAGMTSQLLNWYEEGTFTPVFSTTGTGFTSVTYSTQVGTYTRIGNVVYIVVQLNVSALTAGSPTGDLVVAGYPFTINATYTPVLSIGVAGAYTTNVPSVAQARANNTMSRLYYRAASNGGLSTMSPSELTSTSSVVLSGFYFV